jgi:thymidylate synthase (FAD)
MTSVVTPSQRLFGVMVAGAAVHPRLARLGAPKPTRPDAPAEDAVNTADSVGAGAAPGAGLGVTAIAWTQFAPPVDVDWSTDADGGQALAEFAGRACYQSWDKPNPATATNADYLRHILDVGHLAVLEHASVTFYLTGVPRSLSHELVRHRQLSFSQLSQRHVPAADEVVEPPMIAADPELHARFVAATESAHEAYTELLAGLEQKLAGSGSGPSSRDAALRRKQARQAARSVLPAAAETRLVVTGNYRAWRHFVAMRGSEHADPQMRALAVAVLRQLLDIAPNAFGDFAITALPDGTEVASSPRVGEA